MKKQKKLLMKLNIMSEKLAYALLLFVGGCCPVPVAGGGACAKMLAQDSISTNIICFIFGIWLLLIIYYKIINLSKLK